MTPNLYIFRGLPGSGKSTAARKIGCAVYEADQYHMRGGSYKFNPELVRPAHQWCFERVLSSLMIGMDVAVSNTFTTKKEIERYLLLDDMAKVFVFKCTGDYGNVHDVPEDVLEKMRNRWEPIEGELVYEN